MKEIFHRKQSVFDKHESEALHNGLLLIDHNVAKVNKLYRFLICGHEQYIQPGHVRSKAFRCNTCFKDLQINEVALKGLEMIGESADKDNNYKRFRFISCGHEQDITLVNAKNGEFICKICQEIRFKDSAQLNNIKFIRRCEIDYRYAHYKLSCGHEKRTQIGNANRGSVKCSICNKSYTDVESKVYLMSMEVENFKFLKVGFTSNVDRRISQISTTGLSIRLEATLNFKTGKEAESFENSLHAMFKNRKIAATITRSLIKSGWTECYPVELLPDLLLHFQQKGETNDRT
jgi:hypothetical protein